MLKLALVTNSEGSLQRFFDFYEENKNEIEKLAAQEIEIIYIFNDSDDSFEKDITSYLKGEFKRAELINNYNKILTNTEVDIILDLTRNWERSNYLIQALKNKKFVITTNIKAITESYSEIKRTEKKFKTKIFYSAGFSPLPLKNLLDSFYALDDLNELNGVLNATTNYILSEMEKNTISMKETIEQAKELSYTEDNPDLDLNGIDSLNKVILLADLIYDTALDPSVVKAKGIKGITSYDLIYASELGYKIKLICTIKKENDTLYLGVRPNLVPQDSFLASINENSNGVELLSTYNAKTTFKAENRSYAVLNLLALDLINAAKFIGNINKKSFDYDLKPKKAVDLYQKEQSSFYIRLQIEKDEKIIEEIKRIFSEKNLVDFILHDNLTETPLLPVIIMTKEIEEKSLEKLLTKVENLKGVLTVNNIIAVKED